MLAFGLRLRVGWKAQVVERLSKFVHCHAVSSERGLRSCDQDPERVDSAAQLFSLQPRICVGQPMESAVKSCDIDPCFILCSSMFSHAQSAAGGRTWPSSERCKLKPILFARPLRPHSTSLGRERGKKLPAMSAVGSCDVPQLHVPSLKLAAIGTVHGFDRQVREAEHICVHGCTCIGLLSVDSLINCLLTQTVRR